MRRFMLLMSSPDEVDLTKFSTELNDLLKKYNCVGLLNEVVNPLIIDEKNDDTGYS
jgi:hypothetical protein